MDPIQLMVFLFVGSVSSFPQAVKQVCLGCPVSAGVSSEADFDYLNSKLKNNVPEGMEDEEPRELIKILEVKKQVVSGMLHSYKFLARGLNTKKIYKCKLNVIKRPWNGEEMVKNYSCHEDPSYLTQSFRPVLGGEIFLDVSNNDHLEELKTFISQGIEKVQDSKYLMKIVKYFKVSKKVVNGIIIKATVEVAQTDCQLNSGFNPGNCQIQSEDRQICDVQVWLMPVSKERKVTKVNCRPLPEKVAGMRFTYGFEAKNEKKPAKYSTVKQ